MGREVGRGSPSLLEDSVTRPVEWNHLTTTTLHPAPSREQLPSMRAPPEMGEGNSTLVGAWTVSHLRLLCSCLPHPSTAWGRGIRGLTQTCAFPNLGVSFIPLPHYFFSYRYWDVLRWHMLSKFKVCMHAYWVTSVVSDSLWPYGP